MDNSLTQFYDDLKHKIDGPAAPVSSPMMNVRAPAGIGSSPGATLWRNKAVHHAEHLKDECRKHIILDIYCKIHPLDKEYVQGHQGQMMGDVNAMLDKKGMTATQYLTSCYEATNSPLLEFILRSTDMIGRSYMEEADATLKDAQNGDGNIPEPKEPDVNDEEVAGQLVDIKKDHEYETFIDELKAKTVQKIVDDISKIIADKKEEEQMTFDTEVKEESAVAVGIDYLQKQLWKDNIELTESQREQMIGMAIREAALHQLDVVFKQHEAVFKEFASAISFGKGVIVNESAVNYFRENTNT